MKARQRAPEANGAGHNPFEPIGMMSDASRQQMAVAAESACAMFRGFEAMRRIQEEAAHDALARHEAAAEKLKRPCLPADLLAIETDLIRFDLETATRYWQQLGAAAMEMQAEMLGCCTHLVDSERLLGAASALKALPAMASPFNGLFHGNSRPEPS